jgi:hypothetical protein
LAFNTHSRSFLVPGDARIRLRLSPPFTTVHRLPSLTATRKTFADRGVFYEYNVGFRTPCAIMYGIGRAARRRPEVWDLLHGSAGPFRASRAVPPSNSKSSHTLWSQAV